MTNPFFSIIIPTYNREGFIRKTLDSVFNQTFTDYEVIVVDDGSTDNTIQVIESIDHRQLTIYKQVNKERGAARNNGIEKSKGKFLIFLDSDDQMRLDCLRNYKELISNFPDFGAYALQFEVDQNGVRTSNFQIGNYPDGVVDYKHFLYGNFLACNFCFSRKSIKHLFLEERKFACMEDWIFLIENLRTQRMKLGQEYGVVMNDHDNRSMRQDQRKVLESNKAAEAYLLSCAKFESVDTSKIRQSSRHFRAVHAYIGGYRTEGVVEALRAIILGGLKLKYITTLFKNLIGQGLISRLKHLI